MTWGALDRVTGTPSGTVGPDQHEGTHLPTAVEQDEIQKRLFPARGAEDAAWDGAGASPEALANRARQKAATHAAMSAALVKINQDVAKLAAADRMPIAKLEPAGKEAKRLADEQFQPLVAAAARTQSQESGWERSTTRPGSTCSTPPTRPRARRARSRRPASSRSAIRAPRPRPRRTTSTVTGPRRRRRSSSVTS